MEVTDFFAKYPTINECWQSSDGKLHFNFTDADLHSRMRLLSGKPVQHVRQESEPIIKKTSKKS
jgi:hypothetical protein